MNMERRGKVYDRTIADWISTVPGELDQDAVNLCQIVSAGRFEYELVGAELADFVRLSLTSLLDSGAFPVEGSNDWSLKLTYGQTKQEIINGVVSEWQASDYDEAYLWTVWFARPKVTRG
jgi:hypothetical protein